MQLSYSQNPLSAIVDRTFVAWRICQCLRCSTKVERSFYHERLEKARTTSALLITLQRGAFPTYTRVGIGVDFARITRQINNPLYHKCFAYCRMRPPIGRLARPYILTVCLRMNEWYASSSARQSRCKKARRVCISACPGHSR